MGAPWSSLDPSKVVSAVLAGDFLMLLRESAGADGSKLIGVEDFFETLGQLLNKFPYALHGQMLAIQPANAIFWGAKIAIDSEILAIESALSLVESKVAATNIASFPIKLNGSTVGSMDFAATATVGSFTFGADVTMSAGDLLTMQMPASPDPTLNILFFEILARRT